MTTHVMLDLETLGTAPGSVIISIGAAAFDAHAEDVRDTFHQAIDPEDSQKRGLRIDAATTLWWVDPDRDEARRRWLALERVDLDSALIGFTQWLERFGHDWAIWGNGSDFDQVLLGVAYKVSGLEVPWTHKQVRCFRTLKALFPFHEPEQTGTLHDALSDAIHQAYWLQDIARSNADKVL